MKYYLSFLRFVSNSIRDSLSFFLDLHTFFFPKECGGSNIKVKREAFLVLGAVHKQVGPTFKAISLSLAKPAMRDELEKMYDENPFDRKLQDVDFPKRSLCDSKSSENGNANSDGSVLILEIPRMDLQAAIGDDYIQRLVRFFPQVHTCVVSILTPPIRFR